MKKMTKVLTTVLVIALAALTLAGCAKKDTSPVTTDGSTSMEKVIGTLGEAFTEKDRHQRSPITPPAPAPASRPSPKAAATSACPAAR